MTLLRIYGSLHDQAQHCQWALIGNGLRPDIGEGRLTDLPQRADRVQLLLPAAEVLLARAIVPRKARLSSGSVLAFAVEEKTASEPDANQVSWLGAVDDEDVLAVADKAGLERWHQALDAVGIRVDEVQCETLLLPICTGEWSIAWNGHEGIIRSGAFEGAACDWGDRESPPLVLRLMLEEAKSRRTGPTSIALYTTTPDAAPDIDAWQRELGTELYVDGTWDWRTAPPNAGVSLAQQSRPWRLFAGAAARLRPAAWILGAALTLHGVALVADWTRLAGDQQELRQQMEARFRSAFPDAVAVVDPALQMRRKLVEARHAAGVSDGRDFLPMVEQVALAAKELPAGAVRTMSYEDGRMTVELATNEGTVVNRIKERLIQAGMSVDTSSSPASTGARGTMGTAGVKVLMVVRAS